MIIFAVRFRKRPCPVFRRCTAGPAEMSGRLCERSSRSLMDRISDSGSDGCGSIPHGSTIRSRPFQVGFFHSIWQERVAGRLWQSSASLHPPFGTKFLREPLKRPRPVTLCQSPSGSYTAVSIMIFGSSTPPPVSVAGKSGEPVRKAGAEKRYGASDPSLRLRLRLW